MKQSSLRVLDLAQIGLFAAVIVVLSQLSIPLPGGVPVTLQTFAVALTAYVLKWKKGALSVLVFLALGAVGVPVFHNFTGGFGMLIGVTGGFLWGFLPMAILCGLGMSCWERFQDSKWKGAILLDVFTLAGLAACHIPGFLQYAAITHTSVLRSFLSVSAPFLIKDLLSEGVAFAFALALQKARSAYLRQASAK